MTYMPASDSAKSVNHDTFRAWAGTLFVLALLAGMWNWRTLASHLSRLGTGSDYLIMAATSGRSEDVKAALVDGADPNTTSSDGFTPLMWAAASGDTRSMDLLINAGANLHMMSASGITPLIIASQRGHLEAVQLLLDRGVDPSQQRPGAPSALYAAASFGHEQVIRALLHKGVAVNARCGSGRTALMVATGQNATTHEGIVRLLNAGADPNARDNDGNNAKDEAASAGRDDLLDLYDGWQSLNDH